MAVNFLAELSPTLREKTKKTAARKALVIAHLTDQYELPDGGADAVVALLKEEGGELPSLNRSAVYEDRDPSRTAYVYLNADPEVRGLMDAKRSVRRKGEDRENIWGSIPSCKIILISAHGRMCRKNFLPCRRLLHRHLFRLRPRQKFRRTRFSQRYSLHRRNWMVNCGVSPFRSNASMRVSKYGSIRYKRKQ